MKTIRTIPICLFLLFTLNSGAQFFDSLQVKTGFETRFSSKSYQPLWLIANKYGTVADRRNDLNLFAKFTNKHVIAEHEYQNNRGFYDYHDVSLSYGLSLYNNNHFKHTFAEEAFAKLNYKIWSLNIGRFEETTGDIDPELSSGSLGVSNNALPIPKIEIAVANYTDVPLTNGWLQFKGTLAHGWMGSNRYLKKSLYHQKTLYLRIGPRALKFYGGIQHFAEWGGTRGDLQMDRSPGAYKDVFFAKQSGSGREGDQRGLFEGGAYWENDDISLQGYLQKPFDGKTDISIRNQYMLAGVILKIKDEFKTIQKVVFEVISTKGINNRIAPNQRESLYNNNVYKTGWEYNDYVIGSPLFTNRLRMSQYFPEIQAYDWNADDVTINGNSNILNNRVLGFHTGATYFINDQIYGKTMLTYTQNYGSIGHDFVTYKNQFYSLQEISYDVPRSNVTINAAIAVDGGQLSQKTLIGGMIGIVWNVIPRKNTEE